MREHPHDVDLGVRSSITGGMEMALTAPHIAVSAYGIHADPLELAAWFK